MNQTDLLFIAAIGYIVHLVITIYVVQTGSRSKIIAQQQQLNNKLLIHQLKKEGKLSEDELKEMLDLVKKS